MKEFKNNLKFAWKYAKGQKANLIKYIICNVISIIISVAMPILGASIIINLTKGILEQLVLVSILIYVIENIRNVVTYFQRYYSKKINQETVSNIQQTLGKEILKLENKVVDINGSGVFIQRLTSDAYKISNIFFVLNNNITNIITDLGILGAIFIIDKKVFLFIVATILVLYVVEEKRAKKINQEDVISRKYQEKMSGFIGELVRGLRDIKMLNAEKNFLKEFKNKSIETNEQIYKMQDTERKYSFINNTVRDLSDLLLIFLLTYLISEKEIATASALIIYNYSGRVTNLIYYSGNLLSQVKDFTLSSTRVFNIIKKEEFKKEIFGDKSIKKVKGDFEFNEVTFSYENNKVLDNISFNVKANETVAFVGKSGAGKTTIFNLLCKMYDANSGNIKIDGVNINELDRESIRGNITIINQNPYIFNLTIRENLQIVKEGLTEEEMIDACKLACLDDFIESLPNKYDTLIGEGGINLSGGQKQRLAIARAFVQKTEIILFDEATSALDNETQGKIQEAIENMRKNYTIMIIAHRLSTIINSDRILFLDNGKIEAQGTHSELLEVSEEYKKLYEHEIKNS